MTYSEMRRAIDDAKATLSVADEAANDLAKMLQGRLRRVWSHPVLSALKRELRDYNIHTGKWSNDDR